MRQRLTQLRQTVTKLRASSLQKDPNLKLSKYRIITESVGLFNRVNGSSFGPVTYPGQQKWHDFSSATNTIVDSSESLHLDQRTFNSEWLAPCRVICWIIFLVSRADDPVCVWTRYNKGINSSYQLMLGHLVVAFWWYALCGGRNDY